MHSIRRGLKRKEPDREEDEYHAGLTQFQAAVRKRESIRLKLQLTSAPGILEKEISNKIKIEESLCQGTAKFLSACKNQSQSLEAAKNLLLGNLRVDMLRFELNKLKRGRGSPVVKKGNPSYAAVSLSDIRIPLLWRPKDHIQDTGDCRKFAMFCIARVGAQIYDTALISPIDRNATDVTFNDALLFSKMPPYFELKLEVYSYLLTDNNQSAHSKLVKSISKVVNRTLAKSAKDNLDTETTTQVKKKKPGPQFDLLATATLRLEDAGDDIQSHELYIEDSENDRLPLLFGQFCCRLAVQPYCREEPVLVGSLDVRYPDNVRYSGDRWAENCWARLMDWKLCLWQGLDQYESARSPSRQIRIDQETVIKDGDGEIFTISNYGDSLVELRCADRENKVMWLAHLYQHACDHKRWKLASQQKMEVLSPDTRPSAQARSFARTRSKLVLMYNETKI